MKLEVDANEILSWMASVLDVDEEEFIDWIHGTWERDKRLEEVEKGVER